MSFYSKLILFSLAATMLSPAASIARGGDEAGPPKMVTLAQYRCLVRYLDKLAISRRGNTVDLSDCPRQPSILFGAFPIPPSKNRIFLRPLDLACLKKKHELPNAVASRKPNGMVALYLPCRG